jgi:hypothetical protein
MSDASMMNIRSDQSQAMRTERDIVMCLAAAIGKDRAIRTKVYSRYDVNNDGFEMVCWHDGKFYPFGLGEAVDGEYLDRVLVVVQTILGGRENGSGRR